VILFDDSRRGDACVALVLRRRTQGRRRRLPYSTAAAILFVLVCTALVRGQDALLADQQGTTGDARELLGSARKPLPPDIVLADGLTLKFIEVGEFRASRLQGLEIDLVNTGPKPATAEVTMKLADKTVDQPVELPPNTRRGCRVATPLQHGSFRADLTVKVGEQVTQKSFDFTSAGPYRLTCKPYILSQNAYLVKVEMRHPSPQMPKFRFKLLDREAKKVLWQGEEYRVLIEENPLKIERKQTTGVETLVKLGDNPPGDYVVEVEVIEPATPSAQARILRCHGRLAHDL